MKKVLSLLIVITMMSNSVFAAASSSTATSHAQMIATAFDQFRYVMTVEGQATDADFQAKAVADFKKRMAELQMNGVTPEEIMDYMRASILDSATRADFDRLLASMDTTKLSSEEAGSLAMQFMNNKYSQGASYAGGGSSGMTAVGIILGVVIVGVVTWIVIKHIQDNTNNTPAPSPTPKPDHRPGNGGCGYNGPGTMSVVCLN